MRQRWLRTACRTVSIAFLLGGLLPERLFAQAPQTSPAPMADQALEDLRLYTELISLAHERYASEVSYEDLVHTSLSGILRNLDPHSSFLTPENFGRMRAKQQSSFYGIGILVSVRNGQLTVVSPIEGTPASRLGIQAGDVIGTIEGEPTGSMSLDEAISKIQGPKGTQVNITIVRRGLPEPLAMSVTRAEIPQSTVRQAYMITPDTGYIWLTEFARGTGREMAEALVKLKAQGMKQLLLDLRNNGGGLLDQGIDVASQFLPPDSTIVETRGRTPDSMQSFEATGQDPDLGVPVVVLVNAGTASAAEILSGSIQDHDRGLLVGEPSWGKGLVQTVYNLSYGAGLALTTSRYYTPSGRLIQRDYSSYVNYYLHNDAGSPEVTGQAVDPSQIFETDLGRKVYGGGGITPDVLVKLSELPPFATLLLARNAYLTFAVDYTSRHRQLITSTSWQPGPELAMEFRDWAVGEEIVTAEELDAALSIPEVRDFSVLQIRAEILRSVFGEEACHRALSVGDVQIQSALKLFDQAATMLAQRNALGPPNPRTLAVGEGPPLGAPPDAPPPGTPPPDEWPDEWSRSNAPVPGAATPSGGSYHYQFARAKLLVVEGSFSEALAAFEEAERLAPDAPYVRIEHAQTLDMLSRFPRDPAERGDYLRRAAATIDVACRVAPENLDLLRAAADIYLAASETDPGALEKAIAALEGVRRQDPADISALLSLGGIYLQDQPELTVQVVREAIAQQPQQRRAYTLLAEALLRSNRNSEAEATLVDMLGFDPAWLEARLTLAELQAQREDHEAALATLRAAPESLRDNPRLRAKLAWELFATGDLESALTTARSLLVEADDSPMVDIESMRLLTGNVLSAEGHNREALEILQELQAEDPENLPLAVAVARLLQLEGRSPEGAQVLSRLAEELAQQGETDEAQEARLELARLQFQAGDWAGVEATVTPLITSADEATRLQALLLRSGALMEAKRYDEALAALEDGGGSVVADGRRAEVLYRAGRESQAHTALAALASGNDTESRTVAAQTWQRLGRYTDSIPVLEDLIAVQPASTTLWFMLGMARERTGDRQKATTAFRRSLELQPDFLPSMNYLGYMYAEAGENLDEALRLVQRAVVLDPQNGSYVDSLGFTCYRLGRYEEARRYLERALRLDPSDATIQEHMGDVYVALKQYDRAREAYRRAIELGAEKPDELRRKLAALDGSGS